MLLYRRLHEMVLLILLIGLLNLYDIVKNVNIAPMGGVIYINEKNIIYLLLITLFFFFIFFHSNLFSSSLFSLSNSMEFELILGIGLIGLYFIIISNDLILFFLALELYSLSVYLLLFKNEINQARISILYFLLGSISSSFILLGFSILYSQTGSLDLNYIIENLNTILEYHNNLYNPIGLAFALFLIGLLFKLGAAPFQFWVIRVYTQMDLKILLYQSIVPKIAYIYILSNIINKFENINNSIISFLLFLLFSSALLSLFIGPIGGITHGINKFKSIIGYSSILHVGYLLLGIVSNYYSEAIYLNIFQYLLIYGLNTLQFIIAFYFLQYIYNNKNNKINVKLLFFFFLVSIFSFIGFPPFAGFYAKINIIFNCFYTNNLLFQFLAIFFIIISTLIALFLYLKFINFLYFLPKEGFISESNSKKELLYFFSYFLSFLTLLLFLYPIFLPYLSPIYEILSI